MFVDKAVVDIKGGDGGNGAVSFRHEKFVDRGGPDGGDGGDGGDVIVIGSRNENTLASFRYQRELVAEAGKPGFKQRKHGRSGKDLRIKVPVGTVVADQAGTVLADITQDGQQAIIARGGKGGFGNAHFVSSRRRAPKVAEKGEPGEEHQVTLELKMIAEVGLVGLPNAGKSTLLARVTNAKPEIANYAFTTIRPNLGVADIDKKTSLLIADIPGLIEGASEGRGLGDEFLRHVERTKVLVHLIDAYNDDIVQAYKTIRAELTAYRIDLSKKPEIIAINKVDGLDEDIVNDEIKQLRKVAGRKTVIFPVSATSGQGLKELLYKVSDVVAKTKEKIEKKEEEIPIIRLPDTKVSWSIQKVDNTFVVTGRKIERFAVRTDFDNDEGIERLRDIMRKMGIMHELERRGIEPDEDIIFGMQPELGRIKY
jgi:GTPase